jgi:hypothetical protein
VKTVIITNYCVYVTAKMAGSENPWGGQASGSSKRRAESDIDEEQHDSEEVMEVNVNFAKKALVVWECIFL